MQTIPRYLGMTILTKYPSNCYFGLMKTQISWIVCDRDSSNSWIFGNLEIVKTGLKRQTQSADINTGGVNPEQRDLSMINMRMLDDT